MKDTQEELIRSLLSVVYPDVRAAAERDLRTILEMERAKGIPKGWKLLPDSATVSMHNAAAFGQLYVPARIEHDDDGFLRLEQRCPDWSRVYRVMVDAAPEPK